MDQTGERLKAFGWRAMAISLVVAVVLSVAATLLFGGGFRLLGVGAPGGCAGGVSARCPAAASGQAR